MSASLGQLLLFEEPTRLAEKPVAVDYEALNGLAFLYTATEKGNHSAIHFMMSTDDAMAWCSHRISCGVIRGTPWSYFFTRVGTFVEKFMGGEPLIDLKGSTDNGAWDERIAALGLSKISLWQFSEHLEPFGILVDNAPLAPLTRCAA